LQALADDVTRVAATPFGEFEAGAPGHAPDAMTSKLAIQLQRFLAAHFIPEAAIIVVIALVAVGWLFKSRRAAAY